MKLYFTAYFTRKYTQLSQRLQKKTDKALKLLLENLRHPSLRAKKYNKRRDIWQARVNQGHRFYFLIKKDAYILLDISPHK